MRLQVFLSHTGECSRRKALEFIQSHRVKVNNNTVIEPSFKVYPAKDKICLDNKIVGLKENTYILFNKPKGTVVTKKDKYAKKTVMEFLPKKFSHLFPVGRLDQDTTGLLLLTNDGDLSFRLTHPRFHIDKTYIVTLDRSLNKQHKKLIEQGIKLEDGLTLPCRIKYLDNNDIAIIIREGRKRQIKRMFSFFHYKVIGLKRVTLGSLEIGDLAIGSWRALSKNEVSKLKRLVATDE